MHCYHGKKNFRNRTITITRFIHSRRQRSIKISRTQRQLLKRRRKLPPKQQQKLRPRKQRLQSHLLQGTLQASRESQHLLHSNKGYGIPNIACCDGLVFTLGSIRSTIRSCRELYLIGSRIKRGEKFLYQTSFDTTGFTRLNQISDNSFQPGILAYAKNHTRSLVNF